MSAPYSDSFLSVYEAAAIANRKLNHPSGIWERRICEMMERAARQARPGCSGITSRIRLERVAGGWPRAGSIFIRREDNGERFRLYMTPERREFRIAAA